MYIVNVYIFFLKPHRNKKKRKLDSIGFTKPNNTKFYKVGIMKVYFTNGHLSPKLCHIENFEFTG